MNINIILIIIIAFILIRSYKRSFENGLVLSVFLLVVLPVELSVIVNSALPVLSAHRLILIISAIFYIRSQNLDKNIHSATVRCIVILLIISQIASFFFSYDHSVSLKPFLGFFLEILLFFTIVYRSMNMQIMDRLFWAISFATMIIVGLGIFERYTGFNPVDHLYIVESAINFRLDAKNVKVVYSTFTHPILLGTGISMGFPFILYHTASRLGISKIKTYLARVFGFLSPLCIYFTFSRGPWLAFVIMLCAYGFYKFRDYKIYLGMALAILLLTILLKPGVIDSITSLWKQTLNVKTSEGKSFQYRLDLWRIAYDYVNDSPVRFVFGYGQKTSDSVGVKGYTSFGTGGYRSIESWDNQLAKYLFTLGFFGLFVILWLYCNVIKNSILVVKYKSDLSNYGMPLLGSLLVYIFMSTNVSLFAPQIHFIFWTSFASVLYLKVVNQNA